MSTNHKLQWQELACRGHIPDGRLGESLTTSDDQSAVFLYGGMTEERGQAATYHDDFYVFRPEEATWERRELVPARAEQQPRFHATAFHSTVTYGGRLYVFGGCSTNADHNDLVCVDPHRGTRELIMTATAALGTAGNGAGGNAAANGGDSGNALTTTFAPPTATTVVGGGVQPAPRYCHSAVVFEDAMYVFGGKQGARVSDERLADIYRFDFARCVWSVVPQRGDVPPPRSAHSAVVCGRRMYVFGGRQSERNCAGDLYEYAFDNHTWTRVVCAPAVGTIGDRLLERARHTAVIHNGVIAVFGGWNGRHRLNDLYLHAIDGSAAQAADTDEATAPARRDCHAAVMWRNTMLVFSGRCRVSSLRDVQAIRLGPPSLVEVCRDWLQRHRVPLPYDALPDRLARRLRLWEEIHTATPPTTPVAALHHGGAAAASHHTP